MEDVQLHDNGVQLGLIELEADFLVKVKALGCARNCTKDTHFHRHGHIRRLVQHALNHSISTFTKVLEQL
jgi:hypothetical protein